MKIALITGANRGIGYEIARGLAARGVTALVAARSRDRATAAAGRIAADTGGAAHPIRLDVTDAESISDAARQINDEYGHLDILVNNAGIAKADGGFNTTELTTQTVRDVLETNVVGVVAVTNAMADLLRAADAGRIVNVSSEVGSMGYTFDPDSPLWAMQGGIYAASKAALNRLTTSYAREFWETPIKVNAVTPGYCATDFGRGTVDEDAAIGSRPEAPDGMRTARDGAAIAVETALIGPDGPTGRFLSDEPRFHDNTVPW